MWLVFSFTFRASRPFVELIGDAQARLKELILSWGKGLFSQLLADGIIGGVGTVLSLVPVIFLLFFAISLLEDSGYMARAAFVMDTFLHKIGLHSTSFIPMLLGFSCNLPAIMATKMIRDRNSRLVTILVIPFMSCGARLPVYVLLISAFFGEGGGSVLFSIYLIGIATALIAAKLFRRHLLKGEAEPFIMELPPYRVPTMRGLVTHMWERGFIYIRKASLPIFVGCMLLWLLSNFPDSRENYLVMIGRCIAPVFSPLGFSDWRIASALLSGVFGKEIIVGALGVLYPDLTAMELTPLSAYSLMVFVLLYTPCLPTLIMIKRETESFFWTLFALLYTTTVAWTISFGIYTIGRLF
jgi:ferrous iron transport protein B